MDVDLALRTDAGDVMKKLFPGGGVFNEKAWSGVLGTGTSDVYTSVADAEAKLKAADLKKLTDVAKIAIPAELTNLLSWRANIATRPSAKAI